MDRGYVCLWRKLRDSDVMKHPDVLQVFITLLLESEDYETIRMDSTYKVHDIRSGHVLINYKKFAASLDIETDHLIMILNVLETMQIISHIPLPYEVYQPESPDDAIICIRKWHIYQAPTVEPEYIESLVNDDVEGEYRDDQ